MVRLEEVSSSELRGVIQRGVETAVVPFGSLEDQGGHLPLGSDALLADFVGQEVARRLDGVLAPTVRVGHAASHIPSPGTLSVPRETLRDVAVHIAQSLVAHGFRIIVLVSTHGGNQAALEEAARQINERHPEALACAPRGDVGPDPGPHSGEWLTSAMLLVRPDLVDVGAAAGDIAAEVRGATPEAGARNLERFVSAIVGLVRKQARARQGSAG